MKYSCAHTVWQARRFCLGRLVRERRQPVHRLSELVVLESVVHPAPAFLCVHQPCIDQQFHVVADCRLGNIEDALNVAGTDESLKRAAPCLGRVQKLQDLDPGGVAQGFEYAVCFEHTGIYIDKLRYVNMCLRLVLETHWLT